MHKRVAATQERLKFNRAQIRVERFDFSMRKTDRPTIERNDAIDRAIAAKPWQHCPSQLAGGAGNEDFQAGVSFPLIVKAVVPGFAGRRPTRLISPAQVAP